MRVRCLAVAIAALAIASAVSADLVRSSGSEVVLVSRDSGRNGKTIAAAEAGTISGNGRYATFAAGARVFVRDLRTGRTRRVGAGGDPVISANGRYLAHSGDGKVFVLDLHTGARSVASQTLRSLRSEAAGSGFSSNPSISANGRYLAFSSEATNLMGGAPRRGTGIYVRDLATGRLRPAAASNPVLSASGRYVAFDLQRFGGPASLVVRDFRTGVAINASLLSPHPLKLAAGAPALSADGRFVAFRAGPTERGLVKLYVVDLRTRKTKFVHRVGTEGGGPSFSADGRFLLFDTLIDANVPKGSEPSIPAKGEVYRLGNPLVGSSPAVDDGDTKPSPRPAKAFSRTGRASELPLTWTAPTPSGTKPKMLEPPWGPE